MPGPKRSLRDYIADRCEQFGTLGGRLEHVLALELGPDDGTITARIEFAEGRARLQAFEHIRVVEGRPHRAKYGYQVFIDGKPIFRYDRDPTAHPEMPEHRHEGNQERRTLSGRKTLHDVADELWECINARAVRTPVRTPERENAD